MKQTQTVLNHLKAAGSITQREALMDHSIQSLTKQISILKKQGYPIQAKFNRHPVTKQRYARYTLVAQ